MKGNVIRFKLDPNVGISNPPSSPDPLAAASSSGQFTFRAFPDPTPQILAPAVGSFDYDKTLSKYQLRWDNWAEFLKWRATEEQEHCIELRLVNTYTGMPEYERQCRYVCSRAGTGGVKDYVKLHPTWNRKIETKRTDCKCSLLVKQYPGITMILGNYRAEHNHPLGTTNLRFTQISKATRERIAGLLRHRVAPDAILQMLHSGVYDNDELFTNDLDDSLVASRDEFIQLRDIRRIQKEIEAETIHLHPDDGQSTIRWVENLRVQGHLLGFKSKTDPVPLGSNLAPDVFVLMIQTDWQRHMFAKHGEALLCIDGTHNVTMYENLILTTLVVRDKWGHGIPIAWMLASNGTSDTIFYFLWTHRLRSPATLPRYIISDFDWAQIKACIRAYQSFILLCWWHVLHAWQQHFHISEWPELWELLKAWIRITDKADFDAQWVKIQQNGPPSFTQYLKKYWMADDTVRMWSAVYRTPRTIWEACDTNMLIEAWHHVLKGKFLHGQQNRRLDHLLCTLLQKVVPYYALKQRRQENGFEGPDIEVKKRQNISERSKVYAKTDIICEADGHYLVPSKSDPTKVYEVDLLSYTCNCLDFPLIEYCKHICAVQALFDEPHGPTPPHATPQVPSLASLPVDPFPSKAPVEGLTPPPPSKRGVLAPVTEKLERLAARLRRPRKKELHYVALHELDAALDAMLLETDDGAVLPASKHLYPNQASGWDRTQKAMMPGVKTKRKPAGDPAYGAGASSGSKAVKAKKKAAAAPQEPPQAGPSYHANPATQPYYPYYPVPYPTTTPSHPTTSTSAQPQQSHAAVYSYPQHPQSTPQVYYWPSGPYPAYPPGL